jgi:hypothetical protein
VCVVALTGVDEAVVVANVDGLAVVVNLATCSDVEGDIALVA